MTAFQTWAMIILAPSKFYSTDAPCPMAVLDFKFSAMSSFASDGEDVVLQVIIKIAKVIGDYWQELYEEVRKECDGGNVSFIDGE
jgi:hypothetical protein